MTSTITMNDDLLDNYNPLYDVHLRQYFAMPHMQRHLRNIGLLEDGENMDDRENNKHHHAMIDKILRNREAELQKYADLKRKLHAAEKIEICRRIRSGTASPSDYHRTKASRSLSRGRYIKRSRRRRSSSSMNDKDLVKRIEAENEELTYENPSLVYNRLSTNILKYRYLHKLDDETLARYMEQLRRQLNRLERFRQVSFGPFSVARHQNDPQESWFFRRRSLPSLTGTTPNTTITTTTTTSTITPSTTQSNIYEQPTLRSIQSLSQHRSRSNKPQSSRNTVSANSHDSQSKRQRTTDNNTGGLPPSSRSVKSGPTTNNNINGAKISREKKKEEVFKSAPTEAKKVLQKARTTSTGRGPLEEPQKMKPKTDSETTNAQATISAVRKLIAKSKKTESVERGSEGSPVNFDDEREASVYSGVTSPENIDLRPETETMSEKSVSPLGHSEMSVDDEKRSLSNVSDQTFEESKIESQKNSNLPFDSSPKILEQTELKTVDIMIDTPETLLVAEVAAPDTAENLLGNEAVTDSIPNEADSLEMVLSEEIDENEELDGSWMKAENKVEKLLTDESSTTDGGIVQIDSQQNRRHELAKMFGGLLTEESNLVEDKMTVEKFGKTDEINSSPIMMRTLEAEQLTLPEDELPGTSDAEISAKEVEIAPEDNAISLQTETVSCIKATSNEIDRDVNEFAAINGKTLVASPEEKLKVEDSVAAPEIYSVDPNEILAEEKNLVEAMAERLASFTVEPGKINSIEQLNSTAVCTEIEFSDSKQEVPDHFMEPTKVDSEADQDVGEYERLSELPQSVQVETSTKNEEPTEFLKPKVFKVSEQPEASTENEQETSTAGQLSEKTEISSGTEKKQELEFMKDTFHIEKIPDYFVNEQLKYEEKDITMESRMDEESSPQTKTQQLDIDIDDLEPDGKPQTAGKSESLASSPAVSMNDESLVENSCISEEIVENMEIQREKKKMPETCLEEKISDAETKVEIEVKNEEVQETKNVVQTDPEAATSARSDSFSDSEQILQQAKTSELDDAFKSKTVMLEPKPETDEMIATEEDKLPEITLPKPENSITMGLTNNSESMISDKHDSQLLISTPFEATKQESDGQLNTFTSSTLNTMASKSSHPFEKECRTEEEENLILDKSTDELNLTKVESQLPEDIDDSVTSSIPKPAVTSAESNAEVSSEKKFEEEDQAFPGNNIEEARKEKIDENEMLKGNYASREQERSEILAHENLEKIGVAGNFKYSEEIPKIVVCSHESILLDAEKSVPQNDAKTAELREQFQVEANAEILDQQKLLLEEIESVEQFEISKNDEVVTSIKNDAVIEVNHENQSKNEFLEQYLHDMIQNITHSAEERIKTSKTSVEEPEKVDEIQIIDENQHASSTPKFICKFPDEFPEVGIPKLESDEALQEQSSYNILHTAKSNNFDTSSEISELSDVSRESVNISHSYRTDMTGKFQEGEDHPVLTEYKSNVDYDSPLKQVRSYAAAEFSEDTEHIEELERYPELELEKEKSELEIAQTSNDTSENMLSKYHWIINGLTADDQLILGSVSDSIISSEDKLIDYFSSNNDEAETIGEKISLISDANGNSEWKAYDMQHIPSDVSNESNNCAADVNANVSAMQEIDRMKSVKYEEDMEHHNRLSDEHSSLEQCNTVTGSEVININKEHSVS